MSIKVKCDRCGAYVEEKDSYFVIVKKTERFKLALWSRAGQKEGDVDLCPSCFAELEGWLGGGPTEDGSC